MLRIQIVGCIQQNCISFICIFMSFLTESELFTERGLVLFILATSELSSAWSLQALSHSLSSSACSSFFHFSCCITIHLTTHSKQLAMLTPHFPLIFLPPLNSHKVLPVTPADYFSKLPFTSIPHIRPSASSPELLKQPTTCPSYCRSPPHQI